MHAELYYFTDTLWAEYLDYINRMIPLVRSGRLAILRMHWNNMSKEQREPFVLTTHSVDILARCMGDGLRKNATHAHAKAKGRP